MPDIDEYYKIAKKALELAGEKVLDFYGQENLIEYKENNSPLTKADLASNRILMAWLEKTGLPVLSEEGKDDLVRLAAKQVWIIDPLDGTKDFIQKTGEFTIMVALAALTRENAYRPVLGLISQPVKRTIYGALKGRGAFRESPGKITESIKVSRRSNWREIAMLTSRNHSTELERQLAEKTGIKSLKTCGSSLKACLIAQGEGDLNFNRSFCTWEWDVAASDIIIHEAGGRFTDCAGKDFIYNKKNPRNANGYLASNGLIHAEVVEFIKQNQ